MTAHQTHALVLTRKLRDELLKNPTVHKLSAAAWRLYTLLLCDADAHGNVQANAAQIGPRYFPFGAERDIAALLAELGTLIERYEADGDAYLHLCRWHLVKHRADRRPARWPRPPTRAQAVEQAR